MVQQGGENYALDIADVYEDDGDEVSNDNDDHNVLTL